MSKRLGADSYASKKRVSGLAWIDTRVSRYGWEDPPAAPGSHGIGLLPRVSVLENLSDHSDIDKASNHDFPRFAGTVGDPVVRQFSLSAIRTMLY